MCVRQIGALIHFQQIIVKGDNIDVPYSIWLAFKLYLDIMITNPLSKFKDDWTTTLK